MLSKGKGAPALSAALGGAVLALAVAFAPSEQAVQDVRKHEGVRTTAYLDAVGVPTICYGSTAGVRLGQTATHLECEQRLVADLTYAGKGVAQGVRVRITQGQYDALVSFVYNVGETKFYKSTLLRKLNAGDCRGAGAEFDRWVYAGDKKLRGLIKRRAEERAKFDEGCKAWAG